MSLKPLKPYHLAAVSIGETVPFYCEPALKVSFITILESGTILTALDLIHETIHALSN